MNASVETCEMNLMDFDDIDKNLRKYMPDVLIHCAAAIDKKEIELGKDNAWKNMVEGTKVLATTARDINCSFVFISSDWVFDGTSKLINETSVPFPVNFYGVMKLVSEREIAAIENLQSDFNLQTNSLLELQAKNQEIEAEMTRYLDIFRRHNLAKLAAAKPGLIEPRVNNATKEVFDSLETDSSFEFDADN